MKEKDIIILSMSTLPPIDKLAENKYEFKGRDKIFKGVSQLEPGTQLFIDDLAEKNLENIYIIDSAATRKPLEASVFNKIKDSGFLPEERLAKYEITKDRRNPCMTTVEFFMERMREYVHQTFQHEEKMKGFVDRLDEDNFFVPIGLEDETAEKEDVFLYDAIYKLCGLIRAEKTGGYDVRLFINMVGGRRNDTSILNAVVKMLSIDQINVEMSNTVDFRGNGNRSYIVNTTVSDRILEMVSGMDEFIYTGRGNLLKEFWSDPKVLQREPLIQEENNIIDRIEAISDSISLCAVENFEENLADLSKGLQDYENVTEGKNPLFNSFVTTLQNDYDRYHLLSVKGSKTIDQIEWCVSKELYQQALTLVEAKMPDDMVDAKMVYYGDDETMRDFLNEYLQAKGFIVPSYILENKNDSNNKKIIPGKEKFVFVRYLIFHGCKKTDMPVPGYDDKERLVIKISTNNNAYVPGFRWNMNQDVSSPLLMYNKTAKIPGKNKIVKLLESYFTLAEMRNMVNHGNGDKLILFLKNNPNNIQTVRGELERFIKVYREVEDCQYHIDYSEIVTM